MLERDMEELIAQFPNEFFPDRGFILSGRQQVFPGIGRFDLLFVDCHQTRVLMEVLNYNWQTGSETKQITNQKVKLKSAGIVLSGQKSD